MTQSVAARVLFRRAPESRIPEPRTPQPRVLVPRVLVLRALLILGLGLCLVGAGKSEWSSSVKKAFRTITGRECLEHVTVLASDEFEGRFTGSEGCRKASEYIAARFREMGLAPLGDDGTYFQSFAVERLQEKPGPLSVTNVVECWKKVGRVTTLEYADDFLPAANSASGDVTGALAYLGGVGEVTEGFDVKGFDLRGRIVVTVSDETNASAEFAAKLAELGAVAWVRIHGAAEKPEGSWPVAEVEAAALLIVNVSKSGAKDLLGLAGTSVPKLKLKRKKPQLLGKAQVRIAVSRKPYVYGRGRNIIGIHRGTDPKLRDEAIVIGAHYDHVGFARDRRLTRGTSGELHNGADDNASGVSGLIEIAEAFTTEQVDTRRSIVFIAFDAEEVGLLGSTHYVAEPTFPLQKTMCMLNMDMISRNGPREMYLCKLPGFEGLNKIVDGVAGSFGITMLTDGMDRLIRRSDQAPFLAKGIPAIFVYGGEHPQYHTEDDDVERINPGKIESIARLMFLCVYECAHHEGSFK